VIQKSADIKAAANMDALRNRPDALVNDKIIEKIRQDKPISVENSFAGCRCVFGFNPSTASESCGPQRGSRHL